MQADSGGRRTKEVGKKDERLARFGIFESNTAQMKGILVLRVEPG